MKFIELVLGGWRMGVNKARIAYVVKPNPGGLLLKICYVGGSKAVLQSDLNNVIKAYGELSAGFIEIRDKNEILAVNPENLSEVKLNSQGVQMNIDGHPMQIDFNNRNENELNKAYCQIIGKEYVEPVKVPTPEEIEHEKALVLQREETQRKLALQREESKAEEKNRIKNSTKAHNEAVKKARSRVN